VFFQIGFAAVDAVTGLKLIEGGIPRETIAFLALAAVPIQVVLPAVLRYSIHKPCSVVVMYKIHNHNFVTFSSLLTEAGNGFSLMVRK